MKRLEDLKISSPEESEKKRDLIQQRKKHLIKLIDDVLAKRISPEQAKKEIKRRSNS